MSGRSRTSAAPSETIAATDSGVDRRQLLKGSLAVGAASALANLTPAAVASPRTASESEAGADDPARVILFQGDSITDAGRDRKRQGVNDSRSLGRGYPALVAADLLSEHPTRGYQIHNRGISGNKVPDLQKRWDADCLQIKPDVLSILIGVNDISHKLNGRYDGTVADYESGYHDLLVQTQAALPETRIVICEPFVLRCGAVSDKWFPEFDQRREAAHTVASNLGLPLVPFQTMFDGACQDVEPAYWAGDGVHPTLAGHALMAAAWRKVVGI